MEGALKRNKLDDELTKAKLDDEVYRKQDVAATNDSHRPLSREAFQNCSWPYAQKSAQCASTAADMHQGFRDPGRCKLSSENPKTTLRDKLTVLSPFIFNKVLPTIATTPELPVLKELDEHENLNNSLPKTKRCGVPLKYHSDSEAQAKTIRKKTGCLSPVVEEHSASLVLVAALDKTDESITNDIFDELYKNNPNFDLADLLMVEALQHGLEKDSGIISGKVTQDSQVVENTPVEKDVRHKKLSTKSNAKSIVQDQPEINESELEVIEDTPCYVYDRKERLRRNSTKAVNKTTTQEIVTLDETAIDAFFSQHVNLNNPENIVSPTLAKKINETSSEASDDDCIITEENFTNNKPSVNDLAVEADIIDCVKSIVDKVCNQLDKYVESLAEQERQIDKLSFAKNIDDNSNVRSDVFTVSNDKLKADKDKPYEHKSDGTRKITLKFNQSKKGALKMNTRRKAIKNDKDPNDAGKSKVLIEKTNTSFPKNSTKATLTRNKRKLYSPKNYENDKNEIRNQETRVERRQSNVNQTPIATCYRELENARKSQVKDPRKSRASARTKINSNKAREDPPSQMRKCSSSSIGPALLPKTRKLDEMFDLINDSVVNEEKITLVENKTCMNDLSLYNTSSESEDGDFKKKRYQVHKRISSSSLDVSATKRPRSGTQVNYAEYSSEDEGKRAKKYKTIKQTKPPRSRKINKLPKTNLIEERMRVSQDTLEKSFIKPTVDVKNLEVPEPALQRASALKAVPPDNYNDDLKEAVDLENKTHSPAKLDMTKIKKENNGKKCEKVTRSTVKKTGKEYIKNVSKEKDNASVSPLPGLVETEETWKDKSYIKDPRKSRASTRSNKNSKKSCYSMYNDGEDPPFRIRECTSSSSIVSTKAMSTRERSVNPINYIDSHYPTLPSSSENEHGRAVKLKIVKKIKPRGRKVEERPSTPPVLSPRTRKFNEMFDKIKDNVVNEEKIKLVEKKRCRKDFSLYNLSSESEDGNFKKQQYQVHKGSSSSLASATKRRRSATQVNYPEYSTEDEGKKTKKSKTIKQTKPRSRKTNKIPKIDLIDERMRVAQQDTLETSFVKEKGDAKNLEEPEPALQQAPALEVMPSDNFNDDIKEAVVLENKTPVTLDISKIKKENNAKKCEKVTRSTAAKKEKEGASKEKLKNESKEKDSASVSPLPGLVVETEGIRKDDMTSSIENNLLQKLKKIYTEVHDLNETDGTRTLLLNEGDNDNAVLDPRDVIETVLESDLLSERSIATCGRSPITGHNDLNESPPNIELLNENFQHRDVHNESMSESMAEFLVNMRNQLNIQTSPVIPITRMSTKDSVRSTVCAKRKSSRESIKSISDAESNKSTPKVVLNTTPSKLESKLNPVGTPKSKVSSVVLTRMSSEEIEKYLSPSRTKKSSESGTSKIVLERISSDEINKWLPIPASKYTDMDEQPKKYNTRRTSQLTDTKMPDSVIEKKVKGKISPVKLRFDVADLSMAGYGTRTLRTQSSTKSKSHATNTKDPKTDITKSSVSKAQTSKNDENVIKNSQETSKSSAVTRSKPDERATSVDPSMSKRASVQDWLNRNVSPSAADNDVMKETLCQVMETLQTTLEEIHQTIGERFIAACMENQEEISCLEKDMEYMREQFTRIEEKIATIKKNQMQRACEAIRTYAEKKSQMVKLLQEDIQRVLN